MPVSRISGYHYLRTVCGLDRPTSPGVFFDPADTELGVHVALDLATTDSVLFDLGSGGGATCAAVTQERGCTTYGVDISATSVSAARSLYPDIAEHFRVLDYISASTSDLIEACGMDRWPTRAVVTSNPAYVPLPAGIDSTRVSIDGGPNGLKSLPHVIRHAIALNADLGFTLGSYSTPLSAVSQLHDAGFTIETVTLASLEVGEFTLQHFSKVAELEQAGHAFLRRASGSDLSYLIVGLACRRGAPSTTLAEQQRQDISILLSSACRAATTALETLDGVARQTSFIVRVLDLPAEPDRHHW